MGNKNGRLAIAVNFEPDVDLFEFVLPYLKLKTVFRLALFLILICLNYSSYAHNSDSTKVHAHFGGAVTVTTKGISTIPNLTLGKPAVIFDMAIGRGKLSFEPQFRFSLEGKPWTFLFWGRSQWLNTDKFNFGIGAHPAFSFKTITVSTDGVSQEIIRVKRYLAGELVPTYSLSKNVGIGMYYLYSRGIEKDITQNTNYLALRGFFQNIKLTDQFFLMFNPQIYYLKMDGNDGVYFNSTLTFAKRNFPLSISTLVNKTIQTNITTGDDFLWNVSLIYAFSKKYVKL